MRRIAFLVVGFFLMVSLAGGEVDPLTKLRDDTMKFFSPVDGTVTSVSGKDVSLSVGEKEGARKGMRLKILKEGVPFIHPVTKESLGKVEMMAGKVEIQKVSADSSSAIVVEGEASAGDKVRLSESRIRMLFCQDKDVDWSLADAYYHKLKDSGRLEMVDTALETSDIAAVLNEARKRGAEVALLLTSGEKGGEVVLRESIFWVADGSRFMDAEAAVGADYVKSLKFGEEFFTPGAGKPVMSFDLQFGARFVAMGDLEGDGKQEIVLVSDNKIRTYSAGVDLLFLREIKGATTEEYISLDVMDLNDDGKDEIIATSMKNDEVISHIFGYDDSGFRPLWEGKYFLHRVGDRLFAQAYSASDGFSGDVYGVKWKEGFKLGDKVKLPAGVNIFDFAYLEGENGRLIFAYDDGGFLNLYDEKGMLLWRSAADTGGFLTKFKKKSGTFMSAGEWSVKDRLFQKQNEILVIRRNPLAEMARGIGFKSSQLMDYWWNGFSMEEKVLIDDIGGTMLDYSFDGEQIAVLASPFLGIKFGNILKGENPLGTMLYLYAAKGR